MKRLLHIIAAPRETESRTLQISDEFLKSFKAAHPHWVIDEINLSKENLPSLSPKSVSGKYVLLEGKHLYGSLKETWNEILQHIERFKTADFYVISSPMWNFSIPYMLKHYIDLIVQPQYLFHYLENGNVEGLVRGKKMVIITTRGGKYTNELEKFDFQEPYLKTIFQFIGFEEIVFIKAESMDISGPFKEEALKKAILEAKKLGENG